MLRIWTFVCDLPDIDRLGSLLPILKKAGGTQVIVFPICLLTPLYKLYVTLVFQKVIDRVKNFVTWAQAGFICGHSCGNNLWILCRVVECAIEFHVPLYCVIVDYKGTSDALNRTTCLLLIFLSPSMVHRFMMLYFNAKANVRISDTVGDAFHL